MDHSREQVGQSTTTTTTTSQNVQSFLTDDIDNGKIEEASNLSSKQELCRTHFYDNVFFDEDKCKYVNEICFRSTIHELSSNYRACMCRLIRLENSLVKRTNETGIDFCAASEKETEKLIEKGFAHMVLGPVE